MSATKASWAGVSGNGESAGSPQLYPIPFKLPHPLGRYEAVRALSLVVRYWRAGFNSLRARGQGRGHRERVPAV